jgi:RIO-like serine/threonine protein kinase
MAKLTYLNAGANGAVFRVDVFDRSPFAIKIGRDPNIPSEKRIMQELHETYGHTPCGNFFLRPVRVSSSTEKEILSELTNTHGNVLRSIGIGANNNHRKHFYFMELLDNAMTMYELEQHAKGPIRKHLPSILSQIPKAFECLFKAGFVHGDAHAQNVMVQYYRDMDLAQVKIIDYGLTRRVTPLSQNVNVRTKHGMERARAWFRNAANLTKQERISTVGFWSPNFTWVNTEYENNRQLNMVKNLQTRLKAVARNRSTTNKKKNNNNNMSSSNDNAPSLTLSPSYRRG